MKKVGKKFGNTEDMNENLQMLEKMKWKKEVIIIIIHVECSCCIP